MVEFNRENSKRHMTLVENQPDYATGTPPVRIRKTMKHDDVLYVKGHGPMDSGVMFILPALEEEEAKGYSESFYNIRINEPPELMKGGVGAMLREAALLGGVNLDHHYCTALIKWLLPLDKRNKPNKEIIAWAAPALHEEIRECKPKVIVCFGKAAFEQLIHIKVSHSDAIGGWFYSELYNARVILLDKPSILIRKPERLEDFRLYFREIRAMVERIEGVTIAPAAPEMHFIETMAQLRTMVDWWKAEKFKVFCTDCEWGKGHFLDRNLRSAQFAWSKEAGCAICFLNERGEYIFDGSYEEAGEILCEVFNEPDVKFVGHYISVDLPWLHHLFGVEFYDKVLMDTAFALQTCDEAAGMGLEMMSLTYTGFGRYDIPLMLWHKANKGKDDDGFARIPDEILRPYSIYDVCVPMHALPYLQQRLKNEDLERYYYELMQPFVTNVFTHFIMKGLPMDIGRMDDLRQLYQFAKKELNLRFQKAVAQESWMLLARRMMEVGVEGVIGFVLECKDLVTAGEGYKLCDLAKDRYGSHWGKLEPWLLHCAEAPQFNMQSKPQVVRWLFTCKGLVPIKTTDNKNTGVRAMPWEKVLELPPERQKEYTPATDKQTLTLLAEQAPILTRLLELKDIENLCKAFLKEPQMDDDTGEVTRENGLHYWLSPVDGRLHPFYSLTETGRTRAWRPNPLNIPSYVTDRIKTTIANLMVDLKRLGHLPEWAEIYLPIMVEKKGKQELENAYIPSIRSCVKAPNGWCIVESDDQTAEIRGLAYISGDKALMRLMDETDPLSGLIMVAGVDDPVAIRLKFDNADNSGIPAEQQDPRCIMNLWIKSAWEREVSPEELLRNEDGTLKHPRYDLHWSLAEMVYGMPREKMIAKQHRGAGKVGNFCVAENEMVLTGRGLVPIQDVLDCDVLWDGVEWVHHEGVIPTGVKEVHSYQGLRATDAHEVWTPEGVKTRLGKARAEQAQLAGLDQPGSEFICGWPDHLPGYSPQDRKWILPRHDAVPILRSEGREGTPEYGEGILQQVPLSTDGEKCPLRGSECDQLIAHRPVSCDDPAVQYRYARVFPQLQNEGYQSAVRECPGIRGLGVGDLAGGGLQRQGLRQDRQRRPLLKGEPKTGNQVAESPEHSDHTQHPHRAREGVQGGASRGKIYGADLLGSIKVWLVGLRDRRATQAEHESWVEEVRTYDILNAGPRHRFVCSGLLVSNSTAYGASADTLERKIESDTGRKPEKDTGKKIMESLVNRQPDASDFLTFMENVPGKTGFYVAASGRRRRFAKHPDHVRGISGRTIRGHLSALGREARNFPMQESVAATNVRAGNNLLKFQRTWGLRGYPIQILYDSVVTLCPLEEREIWRLAHDLFMHLGNGWAYGDRILRYPIDHELNWAWSEAPPKETLEIWKNPEFEPTPARFQNAKKWLEQRIRMYKDNPRLSVWNKEDLLNAD